MVPGMKRKLRAGVIGVGHIGRNHARLYAECGQCELASVHDRDPVVAEAAARRHGAAVSATLDDFMDAVDLVSLATPTASHYEIGRQLIERGVHVLIEKPITETIPQAKHLAQLATERDVILQVGHVERFNPVLDELERRLTKPKFIEAHRLSSYPNRSTDIGVVLDLMIHDIEVILHLVRSPVRSLDVVGIPVLSVGEDIANARIRFENGCVANVTASRISPEKMRKIRVFQDDAYLSLDYGNQSGEIYRKVDGRISRESVAVQKGEPLKREIEAFVDCALRGERPVVGGFEATAALDLSLQIAERIACQNRIPLTDPVTA